MLVPNNNRGMTYQTDEKYLNNLLEYFVGGVKIACYSLKTCLLLRDFLNRMAAIDAHERQVFEKLLWGLVSLTIFVRC